MLASTEYSINNVAAEDRDRVSGRPAALPYRVCADFVKHSEKARRSEKPLARCLREPGEKAPAGL